jgi:GT2 family glycosyltransferase
VPENQLQGSAGGVFKLLAVVVLYKMLPSESPAFNTLQVAKRPFQNERTNIRVLLFDNTPGGQDVGVLPVAVQYKADVENTGLANAYNFALEVACEQGCNWLLTLDQDTSLPIDFLCNLYDAATFVAPLNTIAAIVPCLSSDGRRVSPSTLVKPWAFAKLLPNHFIGVSYGETIAVNSGSTFRVSALQAIGGYDARFYIGCSDLAIFHRLHCNNFCVFVAGNIHLEHEMSCLDLRNRSNPERYADSFQAEEMFYDEHLGRIAGIVLVVKIFRRLIYRTWKMGGSLAHFKIGVKFLCRRLFCSRRHRMKSWERSLKPWLTV